MLHEQLGAGGMGAVYRATDRLTGAAVALKRVTLPTDQLAFASHSGDTDPSLALAQEFKTLASLRHPHIISVLDYGFDQQRCPFFTMTLLENAQTIVEAGQGQELSTKVDLLAQALQALAYLYRQGVLHRDLKPRNVLVVDGQIKVLDFGLSVITSRTMEYRTQTMVGTLAYMAPELFQDAPVTRASDLYAVGVMAYELFAGRFPYNNANMAVLLHDILNAPADVRAIGVSDELAAVLERLLVKRREARYGDADEVIRDLCRATGQPLPPETVEIRESFLQAAKFVGRDVELAQLSRALDAALAGQGSGWLVGGESGVGKSRLADELRTLALVRGALVLRGQAISEGGSPYHLWRDVLRWLALTTELAQEEASVLKPLVPDIADLIGLDVPDAPRLDPRTTWARLLRVVGKAFGRQERPAVVILEDLQWARSDSLAMLNRLTQGVSDLPVLMIGNYRDDERPHLPDELPGMRVLKLERLSERSIAELSASMLGEAGRREAVVDLLQRETEGNPFFLVEVVRALAEEAGQLERVGVMTLPDRVFADGVQELVQRRLNRVPGAAHPLLQLAAVAGRELELEVLRALAPEVNLGRWLTTCADVAVLEVGDEGWRFAHHKLRAGVLDALPDDVRPGLHRRVAEAIEAVYPGAVEKVATLAHHWEQAGEEEKAVKYLLQAGDRARWLGASLEAIDLYQSALQKAVELKAPGGAIELHRIHECLGDIYLENLSRHDEALEHYASFLALAGSEEDVARGARKVGAVHLLRGDLTKAQEYYETALARLSSLPPLAEASRVHSMLSYLLVSRNRLDEAAQHAGVSLEISRQIADARGLADAYEIMGIIASQRGDLEAACKYDEHSLKLYRELGDLSRSAQAYNNVGDSYRLLGQMDRALEHLNEGLELARRIGDTRDEALLLQTTAELFLDQGQWEPAIAYLEQALPLAEESGVAARMIAVHRILGSAYEGVGQLGDARRHLEMAETLSRDTQHLRFAARIYLDLAHLNATQAEFGEAERCVELALDAAGPEPAEPFLGLMHRCYGYICSRHGNWDDAVTHLEESLKFMERANLPAEVGKTRLSLGAAYASRGKEGDRGRACEQLLAALSLFRQIRARGYLVQVEVRLKELGCSS